ncbi:MAG: DUF488 domain-containing protein [Gemmatimonadota bacterium]
MRTIYTIGHSTRSIDEFIELLKQNGIERLVDVRRFPGSKRYPHFGGEQLPIQLEAVGITYQHAEIFGGRRTPRADSPNQAWRNPQFRGYADHLDTPDFQVALSALIEQAGSERQVLMCAEAVPWRCHRQLIADALIARGVRVLDIIGAGEPAEHKLSAHARVLADRRVVYPAAGAQIDLL